MDEEEATKRTIIRSIAAAFCVLVLTIGGCSMQQNYVVQEAVSHGVDPVRVSCAFATDASGQMLCMNVTQASK